MLGVEFFPLLWVSHEDGTLEQRTKTARWNSVRLPTGLQGHQQSLGLLFFKKKIARFQTSMPRILCGVVLALASFSALPGAEAFGFSLVQPLQVCLSFEGSDPVDGPTVHFQCAMRRNGTGDCQLT